jgi:hypothetical protein
VEAGASEAGGDAFVSNDGPAVVQGAIQKGPFVIGSTVTLSSIDTTGVPTGQVFTTQTTSDLGDFAVSVAHGNVDMSAQGFYYDEVSGALSTSPIVLRALYRVSTGGAQSAYINIVTHLAHDRALALMGDGGTSLSAAEAQAETELQAALGIGGTSFLPGGVGVQLNEVGANNDQNAYLFAVSAVLVEAAREQAGATGSIDAQLQELIDTIAADLVTTRQLPSSLISRLRTAEQDLDVDNTMNLFAMRLQAIGSTATPADLNRAIDSDGDGYRNSIDTCPLLANPNQAVIPTGVLCKATRHITFLPPGDGEPLGPDSPPYVIGYSLLGDFAGTGHLSVLGCGLAGGATSAGVLLGDGTGRFPPPLGVPIGSGCPTQFNNEPYPGIAYDVDQNGTLDLVSFELGPAFWLPGQGAGQYYGAPGQYYGEVPFPPPVGAGGAITGSYEAFALADFNGDSLPDAVGILDIPFSQSILVFWRGTGHGGFDTPTQAPAPSWWSAGTAGPAFVADVNGDHLLDFVTAGGRSTVLTQNNNDAAVAVTFLGDGKGGFTAASPTSFEAVTCYGVGYGDFDGDGHLDAACWGPSNSVLDAENLLMAFGDGTGAFPYFMGLQLPVTGTAIAMATGDFNADGKTDFAAIVGDPTNLSVGDLDVIISQGRVYPIGNLQRLHSTAIAVTRTGAAPWSLQSGDVNGDGIPDVVVTTPDINGAWSVQAVLMNVIQ